MPEEHTPSSGEGATPPLETPATGTPAQSGATPTPPALTLEEALKKLADLEHSQNNAKEELDRHRKKLSAYEKAEKEAEAVKKAADEAQLSEIERITKQHAELQAQHDTYTRQMQERIVRYEVERQATRLGIIDPDAAAKLLEWSELEYDEDGTPKNAEKLLEKLLKSKPYLAPPPPAEAATNASPADSAAAATPQQQSAPALPPFAVSGRSSLSQPGTSPPGKPPTLADVYSRTRRS